MSFSSDIQDPLTPVVREIYRLKRRADATGDEVLNRIVHQLRDVIVKARKTHEFPEEIDWRNPKLFPQPRDQR